MKRWNTLAFATCVSILSSCLVRAEPFLFVYDPTIKIVSMDEKSVALRLEKSQKAPVLQMTYNSLSLLNFAIASARSLDDMLVVDLNHGQTSQEPLFFVGLRKDSLIDGWLIDARFVTSTVSEKQDKIAYFFDRRDGSCSLKLDEHSVREESAFARAVAGEHLNGFIRVSGGSLKGAAIQAEFIGFENFALFHSDEVSSFGSVCGHATNDSFVKLMVLEEDTKWLRVLQTARRAVCVHQHFGELERRPVTHFRLVGTRFSFPKEI